MNSMRNCPMVLNSTGKTPFIGTSIKLPDALPKPFTADRMLEIFEKACSDEVDLSALASTSPSVDVVIPHYGDVEDLDLCVSTVENDPCVANTLIIDNNETNRGFTKAVNEGIRHFRDSGNPYIAVVNNDTEILEGGFAPLVGRMIVSPKAGIVAPVSVLHSNPDQIQHAGGEQAFPNGVHRSGLRSLGHWDKASRCKWLSFVVVLIRKEAILDVGLLDEKMFLIGSDSDYCYRMRYSGWECWYEPSSVWTHKCGESSGATSPESEGVQRLDMFRWYQKWVKPGGMYSELANEVT